MRSDEDADDCVSAMQRTLYQNPHRAQTRNRAQKNFATKRSVALSQGQRSVAENRAKVFRKTFRSVATIPL